MQKLDSLLLHNTWNNDWCQIGSCNIYHELFEQDFFSVFTLRFNPNFEFTGFRGLASYELAIGIITAMYIYNARILKKSVLWI